MITLEGIVKSQQQIIAELQSLKLPTQVTTAHCFLLAVSERVI